MSAFPCRLTAANGAVDLLGTGSGKRSGRGRWAPCAPGCGRVCFPDRNSAVHGKMGGLDTERRRRSTLFGVWVLFRQVLAVTMITKSDAAGVSCLVRYSCSKTENMASFRRVGWWSGVRQRMPVIVTSAIKVREREKIMTSKLER